MEPAWDEGAERATLAAMISTSREIGEALQEVKAADFYKPPYETIFARIVEMYLRGERVDAISLCSSLLASGDLQKVGGAVVIHGLAGEYVGSAVVYARQVAAMARLRRFQAAALRIRQMGQETVLDDLEKMLDQAYGELEGVRDARRSRGTTLSDALAQVLEEVANPSDPVVMRSGLKSLDEFYQGIGEGQLHVIGGRPAHGKSLGASMFIRENTIKNKFPTVLFTMEMGATQVTRRLISGYAEVDLDKLTQPLKCPMNERDKWAIQQAYDALEQAPLTIIEDQVGLAEITAISRDLFRGGPGFVVIDFHQLLSWPGWARREEEAVGYNAYGLKQLARSQNLHVLALAQLNRNSTQRAGGVPRVEDFGGSDKIGQAADCTILLDRPETRDENERPGEIDLILAKQRDGRTGITTAAFRGHRACFSDMARDRT
jgi:replicative DNA helicase